VEMLLHLGRISTRTELGIMLMVIHTSLLHGLGPTLGGEIFAQPETWKDRSATQPRLASLRLMHLVIVLSTHNNLITLSILSNDNLTNTDAEFRTTQLCDYAGRHRW
jgi:hypothetical protein